MTELDHPIFDLQIDAQNGAFSILPKEGNFPALHNVRLGVYFTKNGQNRVGLRDTWDGYAEGPAWYESGEHGKVKLVRYVVPCHTNAMSYEITFGVVEEYPLVVWKVKVLNQGADPIFVDRIEMLNLVAGQDGAALKFAQAKSISELGFFHNGWQSWSPVGWVAGDGKMPHTNLGPMQAPMIINDGTPTPTRKGEFGSDFFAVVGDRKARTGFVLGFLSQKQHFGSIYANYNAPFSLKLWANGDHTRVDAGQSMETDWAVFSPVLLDHREPLEKYFEAVARENHVKVPAESPVGWCSWYYYYTNLGADDVRANLKTIVDTQETMPVDLGQIDDGFESQVGDWFTFKPRFADGVKVLADEIKQEGLLPGLWLAPFIVHPKSELFKNHPDWILRKADGKPANAGFVWNALDAALDLTVPEALEYACSVVRTASKDWGYPYLKLDFLYTAALPGVYRDASKTRAQVLRMGMKAIREAVGPDVTLLGCGAPFGSMLGLVEAMRIGPDVSGDWLPQFNGIGLFFKKEPSMPCARNSINNILTRANMHQHWWINDPDCLLIRPDSHLSLAEVQSLTTAIALTGGSVLLSDDLTKLPEDRLHIAEVLLPIIGERARVIDWFDAEMPSLLRLDLLNETGEWHLVARFNWTDRPAELSLSAQDFQLDEDDYWFSDFWNSSVKRLAKGEAYTSGVIPPHGCVMGIFRRERASLPQYLGSDLHYSQGKEVVDWEAGKDLLAFTLRLPRKAAGRVRLALPWAKASAEVEGQPAELTHEGGKVWSLPLNFDGFVHVTVKKE